MSTGGDGIALARRRIGLVGLGMAVNKHVLALRELTNRAEIVAGWSPSLARRSAFAAQYGLATAGSLDAILDDATIGIVFILSPPWSHLELVERCAAAGKHVMLEKPVEATLDRAERLVRLCEEAGVALAVVLQNRFRSPHLRLRALLAGGALGQPISTSLAMRWWRPDSYFAEAGRGMKERDGGGVLLSQAIHTMDQLVDLFGLPTEAGGFHATSPLRPIDTEDVVAGAVRWAGGAIGTINATTTSFPTIPERIDVAAEHGSAMLERTRLRVWLRDGTVIDEQEDAALPAVAGDYLAHRRLIEDMLDALDDGREPACSGRSALGVHRLIEALMRSGATRAVERI